MENKKWYDYTIKDIGWGMLIMAIMLIGFPLFFGIPGLIIQWLINLTGV